MRTALRSTVGCFLLLFTGCTTTSAFNPATDTLSVAELNLATSTFREFCIDSLPDFSNVDTLALSKGFEPMTISGLAAFGGKSFRANKKSVIVGIVQFDQNTPICYAAFLGPKNTKPVQDAFVAATTRTLGGGPRGKIDAPNNDIAYHLRNKSAMIFESRSKIDGTSHYIYLTSPMSLENAENLVLQ